MDTYLLGCLINFTFSEVENDKIIVHNERCSISHLISIKDEIVSLYNNKYLCSNIFHYPSKSSFTCSNIFDVIKDFMIYDQVNNKLNIKICTYDDLWQFISGFVDTNSKLTIEGDDIKLEVFSDSNLFLEWLSSNSIPSNLGSNVLTYSFTNVIDLYGKLIPSSHLKKEIGFFINKSKKPCVFYKRNKNAIKPTKLMYSDVGYDLSIIQKTKVLNSKTALWDTGIALQVPYGYYAEIVPRSSISKSGYILSNSIGIIDRSYRGNLFVALTRVSDDAIDIESNLPWKCCQIVFRKQNFVDLEEDTDESGFEMTTRNTGGYGSTNEIKK